jgi:hypothetical protein
MGCLPLANLEKLGERATESSLAIARFEGCCSAGSFVELLPDPVDLEGELCAPRETLARRGGAACRSEDLGELWGELLGEPLWNELDDTLRLLDVLLMLLLVDADDVFLVSRGLAAFFVDVGLFLGVVWRVSTTFLRFASGLWSEGGQGLRGGVALFVDVLSPEVVREEDSLGLPLEGLLDLMVMVVVTFEPCLVVFFVRTGLSFWPELALVNELVDVFFVPAFLGLDTPAVKPLVLRVLALGELLPFRSATGLDFGDPFTPALLLLRGELGLDFGESLAAALVCRDETGLDFGVVLLILRWVTGLDFGDSLVPELLRLDKRELDFGDSRSALVLVLRGERGLALWESLAAALVFGGDIALDFGELLVAPLVLRGEAAGLAFAVDFGFTPFEFRMDTLPPIFFFPAAEVFLPRDGELRLDLRLTPDDDSLFLAASSISEALELCDRRLSPVKSPLGPITVRVGAETLLKSSS